MKEFGKKVLGFLGVESIARLLFPTSALKESGWFDSVKNKKSIDKNGDPLPWLTYPAIDFLKERINKELLVFEYGAGGSSIWFAKFSKCVDSVEHDPKWHSEVQKQTVDKKNIQVFLSPLKPKHQSLNYNTLAFLEDKEENEYVNKIKETNKKYHVVVVDGLFRNNCVELAGQYLTSEGVIILDNTNRHEELTGAIIAMEKYGFKRLDFWGMSPIVGKKTCTTVFYKSTNCLGI